MLRHGRVSFAGRTYIRFPLIHDGLRWVIYTNTRDLDTPNIPNEVSYKRFPAASKDTLVTDKVRTTGRPFPKPGLQYAPVGFRACFGHALTLEVH